MRSPGFLPLLFVASAALPVPARANCEIAYRGLHTVAMVGGPAARLPWEFVRVGGALLQGGISLRPLAAHSEPVRKSLDPARPLSLETASATCSYPAGSGKVEEVGFCVPEEFVFYPPCSTLTETLRKRNPSRTWFAEWFADLARFDRRRNEVRLLPRWTAREGPPEVTKRIEQRAWKEWDRYGVRLDAVKVPRRTIRQHAFRHQAFGLGKSLFVFTQVKFTLPVGLVVEETTDGDRNLPFEATAIFLTWANGSPLLFAESGGCGVGYRALRNTPVEDYGLEAVSDVDRDGRADYFVLEGAHYLRYENRFYSLYHCCVPC